jgi:hypothetical protein
MPLEHLPWAVALLLAALGIVLLSDRMKPKKTKPAKPPAAGKPLTWKGRLAVVLLLGVPVATGVFFRGNSACFGYMLLALLAVALSILFFLLRQVLWIVVKALLGRGPWPILMLRTDGKTPAMKCPRCGARVSVQLIRPGEQAFACGRCGEKGIWADVPET